MDQIEWLSRDLEKRHRNWEVSLKKMPNRSNDVKKHPLHCLEYQRYVCHGLVEERCRNWEVSLKKMPNLSNDVKKHRQAYSGCRRDPGLEHAEGGANEKGAFVQGFQIWINVPGKHKMDDPRYGTVPSTDLPLVQLEGATARVLAGNAMDVQGPFQTVQSVQMIDFELEPSASVSFDIGEGLDTAMLYIYDGLVESVNDDGPFEAGHIVLFDADSTEKRGMVIKAAEQKGLKAMLFAGKKLKEPVAWHGPIVMNTQDQVRETLNALRTGTFPPKRVDWDYKQLAAFPRTHRAQEL
jgi:hypothetical protein